LVVDRVEDHLDAGLVEGLDGLELGDRARRFRRREPGIGREPIG
jgi:hypothetical protein